MFPIYTLFQRKIEFNVRNFSAFLVLRYERISDTLHSVLWADQHDTGSSAYDKTETSGVFWELVRLIYDLQKKTILIG